MGSLLLTGAGRNYVAASALLDGSESDGTGVGGFQFVDGYTTLNATLTQNAGVASDGTTTAALLTEAANLNRHITYVQAFPAANKTSTRSIYAKANGRRYLSVDGDGSWIFDLLTGTMVEATPLGTQSAIVTSCQAAVNGYWKCTVQYFNTVASSGYHVLTLSDRATQTGATSSGSISYTGDGTSGIYLWRPKLVVT